MHVIEPNGIYGVKEVAEIFGLAERTVKRLVYEGKLPAHSIGGRMVFVGAELLQHLPKWSGRKR